MGVVALACHSMNGGISLGGGAGRCSAVQCSAVRCETWWGWTEAEIMMDNEWMDGEQDNQLRKYTKCIV